MRITGFVGKITIEIICNIAERNVFFLDGHNCEKKLFVVSIHVSIVLLMIMLDVEF